MDGMSMADTSYLLNHDPAELKRRSKDKRETILKFIGAETFSTTEILTMLLKRDRTVVYRALKSLEKEGLVKYHPVIYESNKKGKQGIWGLTPTGALLAEDGSQEVDFYEAGRISSTTISHSVATQKVKAIGMVNGLKEWISGRQLKQMAAKDRQIWLQIPDILTTQPDGKKIAFEVELTAKTPKRYAEILGNYTDMFFAGTVDEVFYIGPQHIIHGLRGRFSRIEKIKVSGKVVPVHEKVRARVKFFSYEEWDTYISQTS
jgi:DNA-binding PadR family transcriptional regulator